MIPRVAIVARSGTGKTTFLERLIPLLNGRGYRVGVVKHTHHTIDMDRPGKDSYRLREAGAAEVILNAPNQMVLIRKQANEAPLEDVVGYFRKVDLILIEGYKGEDLPKIEIFRAGAENPAPLLMQGKPPLALVTDSPLPNASFPVFPLDNIKGVADLIEREILHKK